MITRKMKKEPSHDVQTDFTKLIGYVERLPLQNVSSTEYLSNIVLLLSSRKGREAAKAAGALGSIAARDAACKAACVSVGAVPALVSLLSSSRGNEAEVAAWALRNIAWGGAACAAACVSAGAVPALVSLLSTIKGDKAIFAKQAMYCMITKGKSW